MFARNLELLLIDLCRRSDVSNTDAREFDIRFDSLRGYGRLPRGREKRAKRLSNTEIVAALFGLVPVNPNWAGHAAVILAGLCPVGGVAASFHQAATLGDATEHLLADPVARASFVSLRLSLAEHATNSNGAAALSWHDGSVRRYASFVHGTAASLQQPGAELHFDSEITDTPAARGLTFNQRFFERISTAIAGSLTMPDPAGDGSEYNAEEALQARYGALGVRPQSRFLNVGVDTQVTWPRTERLVRFDRYDLVLMPKTDTNSQSVHIDLIGNGLTDRLARTVMHRFLSMLTWCDDQFAILEHGWSGNPVPVPVPRRNLAFVTAHEWHFIRRIPATGEARRGLALYREGRNAETIGLVSYAVLSYFKVIELRYPDRTKATGWIAKTFAIVCAADSDNLRSFIAACAGEAPEKYIWSACRLAVAHASDKHPSDPDDSSELTRLHVASHVLRQLARVLINQELGVSDDPLSGD